MRTDRLRGSEWTATCTLVQALTDRREDGPYRDFPLAAWTPYDMAGKLALGALISTAGETGPRLGLWARPGEAAERYGRLLARLWPGSLDSQLNPKPGLRITVERTKWEMIVRGPSWVQPDLDAAVTLRSVNLDTGANLVYGAYSSESTLIAARWEADSRHARANAEAAS
jgi:hypothetical protein